jgi:hypothetical protein
MTFPFCEVSLMTPSVVFKNNAEGLTHQATSFSVPAGISKTLPD